MSSCIISVDVSKIDQTARDALFSSLIDTNDFKQALAVSRYCHLCANQQESVVKAAKAGNWDAYRLLMSQLYSHLDPIYMYSYGNFYPLVIEPDVAAACIGRVAANASVFLALAIMHNDLNSIRLYMQTLHTSSPFVPDWEHIQRRFPLETNDDEFPAIEPNTLLALYDCGVKGMHECVRHLMSSPKHLAAINALAERGIFKSYLYSTIAWILANDNVERLHTMENYERDWTLSAAVKCNAVRCVEFLLQTHTCYGFVLVQFWKTLQSPKSDRLATSIFSVISKCSRCAADFLRSRYPDYINVVMLERIFTQQHHVRIKKRCNISGRMRVKSVRLEIDLKKFDESWFHYSQNARYAIRHLEQMPSPRGKALSLYDKLVRFKNQRLVVFDYVHNQLLEYLLSPLCAIIEDYVTWGNTGPW